MDPSVTTGQTLRGGGNAGGADTLDGVVVGLRSRWLLDAMSGIVALLSPHGTVLELNRAGLDCTSLSRAEAIGRKLWELDGWYGSDGARRRSQRAVARAARDETMRLELSLGGGDARIFDLVLTPVHDVRGHVTLLILEGHNVTDLRRPDGAVVRHRAEDAADDHDRPSGPRARRLGATAPGAAGHPCGEPPGAQHTRAGRRVAHRGAHRSREIRAFARTLRPGGPDAARRGEL
jgi:PAS domain-containing protein